MGCMFTPYTVYHITGEEQEKNTMLALIVFKTCALSANVRYCKGRLINTNNYTAIGAFLFRSVRESSGCESVSEEKRFICVFFYHFSIFISTPSGDT